jgi:acyl dehydratase
MLTGFNTAMRDERDSDRERRDERGTAMNIGEISVGMSAETSRTVTSEAIIAFAEATGDFNPVHVDVEAG